jgi:hypothetical protein
MLNGKKYPNYRCGTGSFGKQFVKTNMNSV